MKKLNVEFASAHSLSATLQLFAIGGLVEYGLWLAKYGLGEMSLCVWRGSGRAPGRRVLTRLSSTASASRARKRRQCILIQQLRLSCAPPGRRNCISITLRAQCNRAVVRGKAV